VEYLSLIGLNQVLENLARGRFPDRPRQAVWDLGISLIIPTMYDVRKRQSRLLLAALRQTYGQHVASPIRTNVRISEAPSHHKTIYEYDPLCSGAFDYSRLVDTILQEELLADEEPIGLQRPFRPTKEELSRLGAARAAVRAARPPAVPKPPAAAPAAVVPAAGPETAPALGPTPAPAAGADSPSAPAPARVALAAAVPEASPTLSAAAAPAAPDAVVPDTPAAVQPVPAAALVSEPDGTPGPQQCPYCKIPLITLTVAGYRVYQCEHCGYQKQILMRDLRVR
jgi:hypothetical protein